MRTAYTFFLLFLFFTPANSIAQPNSIFFDRISTDNGLINNHVTAVLKDRDGVLWIGTEEGLSKYNGSSFVNYYHSNNDSNSLKGNAVYRLMQDKEGKIWIGSQDVVSYIDPHTDKIVNIEFPYRITTSPGNVNDIEQSPYDGRIWIATMRGLFIADTKNNTLIPFIDKDSVLLKWDLSDILLESEKDAWVTCRYGLLKVDLQTKEVKLFVPLGRANIPENKGQNILTSVIKGNDETLWVGNWGAGLQQFDKRTEKFTMYLPEPNLGVRGDANVILDIMPSQFSDEKNMLWLATGSTGFAIFNTINKQFKLYNNADYNGSHNATPSGAFCLYYTAPEGLWIGTTNGLYRYDKYLQTFQWASFKSMIGDKHCLGEVLTAYADPIDNTGKTYWMSTWTCGNYIYNAAKDSFQTLPSWMTKWITTDSIMACVYRDKQNKLWIGLGYKRLLLMDEKNKTATEIFSIDDETKQKRSVAAWGFMEDSKGDLWIRGETGVYVIKKNSREATHIIKQSPQLPKGVSVITTGITEDANGKIWFCTKADGYAGKAAIGYIDSDLQEKKIFFSKNNNALPDVYSYSGMAYTSYNNTVWAGSDKGIVNWKASVEPSFKLLTRADGLCSERIYRIEKGTHNTIWAATANGVSYYDTVGRFHNFYMEQGLSENDVRRIFPNHITGEVFLAFPDKLCLVNSLYSETNQSPPPVIISSLRVFNKTYTKDNEPFYPDKNAVSLSYSENNITISFSALSYTAPHQNRYAYKMEGLDKDWIYTNTNSVTYSQLPPGDYTFRIKACNSMGVWNEEGTYLDIHVAAPFYRTAWFIISCILLAGYLVYVVYKYRVAQIKKMYGIRNDIARDLHDEIGSTLTSINILSKVSELNLEKDKEATLKHLKQISEQSQNMQQSMSDIVWAIKPDEDKIGNMTERMLEYITHVLEIKNVNVSFDVDEGLLQVVLQMQQRRDFFMLFKEAINNIAKHADAKNVAVKLSKQNKHIILSIKDDGIGFDEVASKFSNGLKNMKRRAEEMGGNIVIHSKVGVGTTVTLSIPQL